MDAPLISFVIPAYNEIGNIRNCLRSIARTSQVAGVVVETVVVDNGSTDGTAEAAREESVTVIERPGLKIGALRNAGVALTSGRYVTHLDADMILPESWVSALLDYFENGFNGCIGFALVPPDNVSWVGRAWDLTSSGTDKKYREVNYLPTANLTMTRLLFDEIGGFDEEIRSSSDKLFTLQAAQAGYPLYKVSAPVVVNTGYVKDFGEFVRKEFWHQGSALDLARVVGLNWRTGRHMLFSLFHLMMGGAVLLTLFIRIDLVLLLMALWLAPSILDSLRKAGTTRSLGNLAAYTFLNWVRWNTAGMGLLWQLFSRR